tara:strand:- start:57 stop:386 length:330 start_codon:yes stop_codon:yes gene_type:complete
MRYIAILLVVFSVLGCSRVVKEDERISYWKSEFSTQIPKGSTYEDIERWATSHNIPFNVAKGDEGYFLVLEETKENSVVCVSWVYKLAFQVNEKRELTEYEIGREGRCL